MSLDGTTLASFEIDPSLLNDRLMLDSGVVIRALGDRPKDPESPHCRALWKALVRSNKEILIAAPTLTEVLRKVPSRPPPATSSVVVVAFDQSAALLLARAMPMTELEKHAAHDYSKTRMKYDALIIACAARHRASALVTLEQRKSFHSLAAAASVKTQRPIAFTEAQALIPGS